MNTQNSSAFAATLLARVLAAGHSRDKKGEAEVKSFTEAEAQAEADAQARSQDAAGNQGQK